MSTSPAVDPHAQDAPPPHTQPLGGTPAAHPARPLLICLPSMTTEATTSVLTEIGRFFPPETTLVASPDRDAEHPAANGLPHLVPYTQPRNEGEWVLNATDYAAAASLAAERNAGAVLVLGPDAASLHADALRAMEAGLAAGADLALPRYHTAPDDALVNSALLYPLTRALFAADIRFPLPLDAGLSARMAARLAQAASRANAQGEAGLVWPVAEAAVSGSAVRQVEGGMRALPQPPEADLNELFPAVTASLFSDIESKATYWQRARPLPGGRAAAARPAFAPPVLASGGEDVRSLLEGFRIAFSNLREIWSLVLPPQSLLALKKLSLTPAEGFAMPPSLWARSVYDFALAYHLRTLNRGHLLGALTPLYLAWVASFLRNTEGNSQAATDLLETTAAAFEQEKPYLVSRWRWPDRFNP